MPLKRKRDASPSSKGLAAGEPLKRTAVAIEASSWGWVGSEATETSAITEEHLTRACGLSSKHNTHPFCRNKFAPLPPARKKQSLPVNGQIDEDIIVISSDEEEEELKCMKRLCKNNPNCLNHLGQKKWEDEEDAREMFVKIANLGSNPAQDARDENLPVGLKNLGATCYANASLQVWFRDMAFRSGVYNCQPTEESSDKFKDSPIFQLQVTFAALQESTQSVFNPTKLVESLELRTTEQQDAQEFSKLFMSHLDAEFKKQSNPSLKSLITDQFQGKQIYGTICQNCGTNSARETDFLEIEINFQNNAKLEDSIAGLLQKENLSGDNQYLCSTCETLQDAVRYTDLASFPPVLHFSLLRFVYDFTSMQRKKSKHSISFPTTLDMTRFLGSAADRKSASTKQSDENIYELRGVLLHKGKSAYHGHYEAQVFDATQHSWFQFNDETVTKIKKLGDSSSDKKTVIDIEAEDEKVRARKRESARKRQRVDDSDDEVASVPGPSRSSVTSTHSSSPVSTVVPRDDRRISSKDAYMLIYARKDPCVPSQDVPIPPSRAMEVVNSLNTAHDDACKSFGKKEKMIDVQFEETRRKVLNIYRSWSVGPNDKNYAIVSQQALEGWIEKHAIKAALADVDPTSATLSEPESISIKDILCPHGLCDHRKAGNIKRITMDAYNKIHSDTCCLFDPPLTSNDICRVCVEQSFQERIYYKQHPLFVTQFDAANVETEQGTHWISKRWLRDWRLAKPKMHVASQDDPAPDSAEFETDIRCEHGGLSLNSANRARISTEAYTILRSLYPFWEPMPGDMDPCMVCDGLLNMGKEDRLEARRRAEEEKARLKHMYDNALNPNSEFPNDDTPLALVPVVFVRAWRQWLSQPTEMLRPDSIHNTPFICEHQMLAVDPNCSSDWEGTHVLIKRADWDALEKLYSGGPLIALEKLDDSRYTHDIPVCTDCRQKRKTEWTETEITIRKGKKDKSGKPESTAGRKRSEPITYKSSGSRHSKRLQQGKDSTVTTRVTVSKSTTVKEIKVEVQKKLDIPTICQRLFYGRRELDDNTATVASLEILANDTIDLKEETEVHEISSDSEDAGKGKRRDEGFGGTLLGRTDTRSSSPPKPVPAPTERACGTCTFSNPVNITICGVCEQPTE